MEYCKLHIKKKKKNTEHFLWSVTPLEHDSQQLWYVNQLLSLGSQSEISHYYVKYSYDKADYDQHTLPVQKQSHHLEATKQVKSLPLDDCVSAGNNLFKPNWCREWFLIS